MPWCSPISRPKGMASIPLPVFLTTILLPVGAGVPAPLHLLLLLPLSWLPGAQPGLCLQLWLHPVWLLAGLPPTHDQVDKLAKCQHPLRSYWSMCSVLLGQCDMTCSKHPSWYPLARSEGDLQTWRKKTYQKKIIELATFLRYANISNTLFDQKSPVHRVEGLTDIATYRLNRLRGRCIANVLQHLAHNFMQYLAIHCRWN